MVTVQDYLDLAAESQRLAVDFNTFLGNAAKHDVQLPQELYYANNTLQRVGAVLHKSATLLEAGYAQSARVLPLTINSQPDRHDEEPES